MLDFGFYNMDCMEGMKQFPDKYFDLAIVDPPYGNGNEEYDAVKQRFGGRFDRYKETEDIEIGTHFNGRGRSKKYFDKKKEVIWDIAPTNKYFQELFRVSKKQIIWGGNYFLLPPTRCFIIWEKVNIPEQFSMAMCEYAWTNLNGNAKIYKCSSQRDKDSGKFHPTEKPIRLYEWLLNQYADENDIILDTHVGSASSLIACHRTQHKFVGFELNKSYFQKAKERLDAEINQMTIFDFIKE